MLLSYGCVLLALLARTPADGATCKTRDLSGTTGSGISASGPQFQLRPPAEIQTRLGATITIECEGYFGPGMSVLRDVIWRGNDTHSNDVFEQAINNGHRYNVSKYDCEQRQYIGRTLTIAHVIEADFNVTLQCRLISARLRNGKPFATVRFKPYPDPEEHDVGVWVALGVVLPIVVVIVVAIVCFLCWAQIAYYFHITCRRPGAPGDRGVVFIHDEANTFMEDTLYSFIKDLSHPRPRIMGIDLSGDMSSFSGGQKLMSGCRYVVFVVTPGPEVALFTHLIRAAIEQGLEIVLVEAHPQGLKHSLWSPPGNYLPEDTSFLAKRKIRWPGDQLTERQKKNFLYKIGRRLPPPTKTRDENSRDYSDSNGHNGSTTAMELTESA